MALITKPSGLAKVWATSGVKETPSDSKIAQGWVVELPPYQYDNWLSNRQDSFNAHVNQVGIPIWDSGTEYIGGKSYVQGSDGVVYKALLTNTNVVPSNPLNYLTWVKAFEDYGSVAALTGTVNNHLTNYSTLSGISNPTVARANLSLYSKTESDNRFAPLLGNASNTFHVADAVLDTQAINRGQVYSLLNQATESTAGIAKIASQTDMNVGTDDEKIVTPKKAAATLLKRSNNLSDVTNVATARTNLGIYSKAEAEATFLIKASNLSDLTSVSAARTNLGLGTIATASANDYLSKSGNLSGLANQTAARNNLGLQSLATFNSSGVSVANLAASLLNFDSLQAGNGWMEFPNGIIFQWGETPPFSTNNETRTITYPRPFPNSVFFAAPLGTGGEIGGLRLTEGLGTRDTPTTTSFVLLSNWEHGTTTKVYWIALGN